MRSRRGLRNATRASSGARAFVAEGSWLFGSATIQAYLGPIRRVGPFWKQGVVDRFAIARALTEEGVLSSRQVPRRPGERTKEHAGPGTPLGTGPRWRAVAVERRVDVDFRHGVGCWEANVRLVLCAMLVVVALVEVQDVAWADTILTFDISGVGNQDSIPQSYGDRVSTTPNVVLAYRDQDGNGLALWDDDFSDLTNVAYNPGADDGTSPRWFEITLTADAGFEVLLNGFDLGNWLTDDQTVPLVSVLGPAGQVNFSSSDVVVNSRGGTHASFDFSTPLAASALTIRLDTQGPQWSHNLGVDNISFGQRVAPVPEPGTLALLGLGLFGVALHRRRRMAEAS